MGLFDSIGDFVGDVASTVGGVFSSAYEGISDLGSDLGIDLEDAYEYVFGSGGSSTGSYGGPSVYLPTLPADSGFARVSEGQAREAAQNRELRELLTIAGVGIVAYLLLRK